MRERETLVTILLTVTLLLASTTGSAHACQEMDPSEYNELSYNLLTLSWDPSSYDAGPIIAEQLAMIGIKVVDQPTDDAVMFPNLYESPGGPDDPRRFDMYEMSHGFMPYPNHLWDRMHSSNDIDWGDNLYNLHDSEMDDILEVVHHEADNMEEQHVAIHEVQQIWAKILPYIPLYLSADVHAIGSKWRDYVWDMPGGPFGTWLNYLTPVRMWAADGDTEFVMAYPSDLRGTNPMYNTDGRSTWYHMLVYAPLLAWDKQLNPIPWLATAWKQEVIGSKTVVTFTIRNGAKWHDGTPVTGEDIAFTFLYGQTDPSSWYYEYCRHVESAVADGNTVTVIMDSVNPWALYDLGTLFILPKHNREGSHPSDPHWDDPNDIMAHMGCGPFKFVNRIPDVRYSLERFDDFWEPAKIQTFKMRVIRSSEAIMLAMSVDEVDTERYNLAVADVSTALTTSGITVVSYADMWDYNLGFNLETPGLDDYEVRKAIAYALDKQAIVDQALLGHGTVMDSPVPSVFYPTWYNPDTPPFTTGDQSQDIEIANQILDDAGYLDVDGDGIREFPTITSPPPITTTPLPVTTIIATNTVERETPPEPSPDSFFIPSFRVVEALGALLVLLGFGMLRRRRPV